MKPEARVGRDILTLLRTVGFAVWSTEQGYRKDRGGTRTTPGFPDLVAIGCDLILFIEVKAGRGSLTTAQEVFRDECQDAGGNWLCARSDGEVWDWLVELGVIENAEATNDE